MNFTGRYKMNQTMFIQTGTVTYILRYVDLKNRFVEFRYLVVHICNDNCDSFLGEIAR